MGKHGPYDAAYLFFKELTNPEGPHRLQPERVPFHPDDYPSDAPLYGTRVLGTPIGHDAFMESYLHNSVPFRDESSWEGVMESQSCQR